MVEEIEYDSCDSFLVKVLLVVGVLIRFCVGDKYIFEDWGNGVNVICEYYDVYFWG